MRLAPNGVGIETSAIRLRYDTNMPYKDPDTAKAYQQEYQRHWIARRRGAFFADKVCVQCGSSERLELDHVDPATKVTSVIWSWSQQRRDVELAKCQVLCHACHVSKTKLNGDMPSGEKAVLAKLTEAQAIEAIDMHSKGSTFRELGDQYGVHSDTIRALVRGGTWKHLGR